MSGGNLKVNDGTWTLRGVEASGGTVTFGNGDFNDNNDEAQIAETVVSSMTSLYAHDGATVTVNKDADVNVSAFAVTSGSSTATVTVSGGSLTIAGADYTSEDDSDLATTFGEYGVKYDAGTLKVQDHGTLTFTGVALDGLFVTTEYVGEVFENNDGEYTAHLNSDYAAVEVTGYATLALDFDDDVSFSQAELIALKKALVKSAADDGMINAGYLNIGAATITGYTDQVDTSDPDNYKVDWDDIKDVADVLYDVKNETLMQAQVYNVKTESEIGGHYGSLLGNQGVQNINIAYNTSLNKADADGFLAAYLETADGPTVAANLDVTDGVELALVNGGTVGTVTLGKNDGSDLETVLTVQNTADSVTNIEAIVSDNGNTSASITNGTTNVEKGVEVTGELLVDGVLNVGTSIDADTIDLKSGEINSTTPDANELDITVGELFTSEGTSITAKTITYSGDKSISVTYADAVYGDGNNSFIEGSIATEDFNVNDDLVVAGNVQVSDTMTVGSGAMVIVGVESLDEDNEETADVNEAEFGKTGNLYVNTMNLSGGSLIVGTDWSESSAYAVIGQFGEVADELEDIYSGTVDGNIYVGKNAVLGIGFDSEEQDMVSELLSEATLGEGLTEGGIENALVLGQAVSIDDGQYFYLSSESYDDFFVTYNGYSDDTETAKYQTTTMDAHSALVIDMDVFDAVADSDDVYAAVQFEKSGSSIYAPVVDGSNAKVIVTGDYTPGTALDIFYDGDENGVDIIGQITVQSPNGFWVYDMQDGTEDGMGVVLAPSADSRNILRGASNPVYELLMKYAYNDADYINRDEDVHEQVVVYNDPGVYQYDEETGEVVTDSEGNPVRELAYSKFLNNVLSTGNGQDAETVARMAVYGGAAEVAMAASSTTYEAISARMGMGNPNGNLIMADNANGAGIWLAPVYKNHESDDFDAQGVDYGVDLDLYGVALGADYTFAPGFRVGAMFNVGSGDADGKGAGSAVSNDFDYWSAAIYAGFAYENFSIAGDVTYTAVDNDMDASTSQGRYYASMDADVFTVGLTAQYKFEFAALDVTPHIGMRYSYIDIDDYSVGDIAQSDVDDISVFSIPVGVSLSKDFATASGWVVKPALDLTITANTGDDEVDSDVRFNGVDLTTNLSTEFIDDVTYGATLGLQVQKDSFQFGLGVNYTGSENTDEYGVAANARFTF